MKVSGMDVRIGRLIRRWTGALLVVLLATLLGTASVTQADPGVSWQIAFVVDGSGSMSDDEWNLMIGGLASAITDPCIVAHNGTIEVWVIQFAQDHATLELDRTLIDSQATAEAVAAAIKGMVRRGGYTPMGSGIQMAKDELVADMRPEALQLINLVTNGLPQPESQVAYAEAQRDLAVAAGVDGITAEALDVTPQLLEWLRSEIVYPEPGVIAPPYPVPHGSQGWVRPVASFEEFAEAVLEKYTPPCLTFLLDPSTDTDYVRDTHTVTACYMKDSVPMEGQVINFEVLSGPHGGTTGISIADATGCTTFSYVGTTCGTDTIVASTDTSGDGVDDFFSIVVTKTWVMPPLLTLEPPQSTNSAGGVNPEHTVLATYRVNAVPQPGHLVDFLITDGPNAGLSGSDATDAEGEATWTYTDTRGIAGTDVIQASVDTGEQILVAEASKHWVTCPPFPTFIPGASLWSGLAGVSAVIGLAVVLIRRRRVHQLQ